MFGLTASDFDDVIEVWADNWPSFAVMEAMTTQWRVGAGGATGLDYGVLPDVMRLGAIPKEHRAAVFHDVRVMELEALAVMAESRNNSP